ncbi:hypothetical protein QOZ80_8AG0631260 [Eleusine coracana subsp. coracana]|nr:hypothetical protein QOZ80_8AG0631260 [Eleusine coracana subsp. coracana]
MWQSVGVGGVLQAPKWRQYFKRPSDALVIHRRRCKVAAGAADKCETDGSSNARRMPSLPNTVRLKLAAYSAAQRPDGSFRYHLLSFGDLKAFASPWPDGMSVHSTDVTIDASRGLWARVFSPSVTRDTPLPVVVYFHGGGFMLFSAASHHYDTLCRRLCQELGAVVVSVNYRLAPQHRFPTAYNDGMAALRYLDDNALHVPVDISSCFVAGDSSGGNIAHHVAQRWSSISSTSSPPVNLRLAGAILIQPLFGGVERTKAELELHNLCPTLTLATADYFWREFLPEDATRDHVASRVCGRDVESCFTPTMVVTGGFDLLRDRHAGYVEELREEGKPVQLLDYPDAIHGFYLFPEIMDSGKILTEMKLFVQEHKSKPVV